MNYDNQDFWSQNSGQNTYSQQSYDFGSFNYNNGGNQQQQQQQQGQQQQNFYPTSGTPISSPFGGGGSDFGMGNAAPSGNFDNQFGNDMMTNMEDPYAGEPPLLEELGINFEHIVQKTFCVLNPFRNPRPDVILDADLAGPLVFGLAFGSLLLLAGKVHFSYIYGFGVLGCILIYWILRFMSLDDKDFSIICAISILGYCLLPMVFLSAVAVLVSLNSTPGMVVSLGAILWCSLSASKLFITALKMHNVQPLVAYPCFLFYGVFALLALF